MPFNLNDSVDPDTAPAHIIGQINALANQVKKILGGQSWKDEPQASFASLKNTSTVPPASPVLGQYWDEINAVTEEPIASWFWNGTFWIERNDRIMIFRGGSNNPYPVPKITSSTKIWIKEFSSTTTGGEANSSTKFYEYRLGDMYGANAVGNVTTIASNFSKTPGGRVNYINKVNVIISTPMTGLNINSINNGSSSENPSYSGHSILYRCVR